MAVRPVLLVPDPRLKQACEPIAQFDDALHELVQDLEDTMHAHPGCVGIAACQIGVLKRVALVDTSIHKKHGAVSQGRMVLINPSIAISEGEWLGREGCLSLPDFTANVRRSQTVQIRFQNGTGEPQQVTASNFEAVAIQHEIDHLNGILFLDRVSNLATDVFPRKTKA
ncbi:MAG: peptide deformylase [Abitibacteriaceae bacterium]|nr:peptide deformylase [Abditibacteriaceae bacterium]